MRNRIITAFGGESFTPETGDALLNVIGSSFSANKQIRLYWHSRIRKPILPTEEMNMADMIGLASDSDIMDMQLNQIMGVYAGADCIHDSGDSPEPGLFIKQVQLPKVVSSHFNCHHAIAPVHFHTGPDQCLYRSFCNTA